MRTLVALIVCILMLSLPAVCAAEQAGPLYGDANGDGKINVADAIVVCKLIARTPSAAERLIADVDGDGTLSVRDLVHICRYVLGLETEFPRDAAQGQWGADVL